MLPEPPSEVQDVPEAVLVLDADVAEHWLRDAGARLRGTVASVRFEPEGMPTKQVQFPLSLAAAAIAKEVFSRKKVFLGVGVLYVPAKLARSDVLSNLVRGERVGKYVAFRRC